MAKVRRHPRVAKREVEVVKSLTEPEGCGVDWQRLLPIIADLIMFAALCLTIGYNICRREYEGEK